MQGLSALTYILKFSLPCCPILVPEYGPYSGTRMGQQNDGSHVMPCMPFILKLPKSPQRSAGEAADELGHLAADVEGDGRTTGFAAPEAWAKGLRTLNPRNP